MMNCSIQAPNEEELWNYALAESIIREAKKFDGWFYEPGSECFVVWDVEKFLKEYDSAKAQKTD